MLVSGTKLRLTALGGKCHSPLSNPASPEMRSLGMCFQVVCFADVAYAPDWVVLCAFLCLWAWWATKTTVDWPGFRVGDASEGRPVGFPSDTGQEDLHGLSVGPREFRARVRTRGYFCPCTRVTECRAREGDCGMLHCPS